jgi:hypothetical protein
VGMSEVGEWARARSPPPEMLLYLKKRGYRVRVVDAVGDVFQSLLCGGSGGHAGEVEGVRARWI